MADKIKVNPEELRAQAKKLKASKKNHASIRNRMGNLMVQIALEWKGEASDAYIKQFGAMIPSFLAFDENTEQLAKILEMTAEEFEEKDKSIGKRFEALD